MKLLLDDILPIFSQIMNKSGIDEKDWKNHIGRSTVSDHGDISFPCHVLSRHLKNSPEQISIDLVESFGDKLSNVAEISSLSGFINFKATKIWVCGPPIMQEGFDRSAMKNKDRYPQVEFAAL